MVKLGKKEITVACWGSCSSPPVILLFTSSCFTAINLVIFPGPETSGVRENKRCNLAKNFGNVHLPDIEGDKLSGMSSCLRNQA